MEFKKTEINDILKFKKYFENQCCRIVDFSPIGSYIWKDFFKQECCFENDVLYLKYIINYFGKKNVIAFSPPLCEKSKEKEAYLNLKEYANKNNFKLIFKEVSCKYLEAIDKYFIKYISRTDNDWAEYIYDIDSLITLKGKKLSNKRNHINKFIKNYGNRYKIEKINFSNINDILLFQEKFYNNNDQNIFTQYENNSINNILKNYEILKPEGLILYVDNKIVAYTIGEVVGNMLFVHIEKASREIEGAYNVINQEFVKYIKQKYSHVERVNREDDSGDLGLRQAKRSYSPIDMINKHIVEIEE